MKDLSQVVRKPLVTERFAELRERDNKFIFEVHPDANKHEIRDAVQEFFQVTVEDVRTIRMPRKSRRVGKFMGRKPEWKKAIVVLAEGQSIEFFEGV